MIDSYLRNRFPPLVQRTPGDRDRRAHRCQWNGDQAARRSAGAARDPRAEADDIEAVAICTLFATVNPVHEKRLQAILKEELPDVFVSASHEISPNVGEYARMSTTAANAALGPLAGRYLSKLEDTLRQAGMRVPVLMMTCAGGVLPTSVLNDRPVFRAVLGTGSRRDGLADHRPSRSV